MTFLITLPSMPRLWLGSNVVSMRFLIQLKITNNSMATKDKANCSGVEPDPLTANQGSE